MTGTGTEQDPYLVKTPYDFMELHGKSGYARLENNIDFNDHEELKYGWSSGNTVNATELIFNGNKKEIRNLVFKDVELTRIEFKKIYDTYFVNMVCINCGYWSYVSALISAEENIHNSFNMMIMSPTRFASHIPGNMNECTWNFTLQGYDNSIDYEYVQMQRSHIIINCSTMKTDYALFRQMNADTCVFDGSFAIEPESRPYLFDRCQVSNSVFNFDLINDNNIAFSNWNESFSGISIFNNTKIKFSNPSSDSTKKFLTDEQMRDNVYLQSIGFPVTPRIVGE